MKDTKIKLTIAVILILLFCAIALFAIFSSDKYDNSSDDSRILEPNSYNSDSFSTSDDGTISYSSDELITLKGIDVSYAQGDIDWASVASDGIDFVMIRCGYRGYTEGGLFEDSYFEKNIKSAKENGLKVGIYFYSQSITEEEAIEEAKYTIDIIKDYDIDLPVAYDWELISKESARTDSVTPDTLTKMAVAFCDTIENAGYTPMIYAYQYLANERYNLKTISKYEFWLAEYEESPSFKYNFEMWQYTNQGSITGINGIVDLNLYFTTK